MNSQGIVRKGKCICRRKLHYKFELHCLCFFVFVVIECDSHNILFLNGKAWIWTAKSGTYIILQL